MNAKSLPLLSAAMFAFTGGISAEEGGSGRYAPGALSSTYDFPGTNFDSAAVVPQFSFYDGETGSTKSLPIGAKIRNDVDVEAFAAVLVLVDSLNNPVLGGTYSAGIVVPWVHVQVSSRTTLGPLSAREVDHADGLADISILPGMIAWKRGLNTYTVMTSVVAPTGQYDATALASTGKNFWTLQAHVGINRVNPDTGRIFTAFAGMEFNTKNKDTDYQSGETFHVDGTYYQQFAGRGGAKWSVGVNAFFFQQITGDSGSGAVLGDNKGRTMGAGPALGWEKMEKKTFIFAELKWLPEFDVTNRTKGYSLWLKAGAAW